MIIRAIILSLFTFGTLLAAAEDRGSNQFLPAVPKDYHLQAYDDCGVQGRQPHIEMQDCYLWTFAKSDTHAGLKERSAVFSYKGIQAVYTNLDPKLSYVLALTYANDHTYHRVQSLEANGVVLHGPYALPKGKATRLIVRVPPEVTRDGRMTLSWKIHGEVNATVSIIELWADKMATNCLRIIPVCGLQGSLQGQVLDMTYDAVAGAQITASAPGRDQTETANSGSGGVFSFSPEQIQALGGNELLLTARFGGQDGSARLNKADCIFEPVRYRPIAAKVQGLKRNTVSLDGAWRIDAKSGQDARQKALNAANWGNFLVPGQWAQQGYDVPLDKTVALAREFTCPGAVGGLQDLPAL